MGQTGWKLARMAQMGAVFWEMGRSRPYSEGSRTYSPLHVFSGGVVGGGEQRTQNMPLKVRFGCLKVWWYGWKEFRAAVG